MSDRLALVLTGFLVLWFGASVGLAAEPKSLLDEKGAQLHITPSSAQVSAVAGEDGITVSIEPGKEGYPGITLTPSAGGMWDLSGYGHLRARITNTGTTPLGISLRIDDDGPWQDNPWNAEQIYLKPGAGGEIKLVFGHSWGQKPAYKLNPAKITRILLFSGSRKEPATFQLQSLVADGPAGEKPPIDPASIRIVPQGGKVLGGGIKLDADKQLKATNARATIEADAVVVRFENKANASLKIMPPQGRWDLRQMLEARVKVQNVGEAPVTPRLRVDSNKGNTLWYDADEALRPGQEVTLTVPFASTPWNGAEKDKAGKLGSDAVSGVVIALTQASEKSALKIGEIVFDLPAATELPDWLGKRPPVQGDWTLTLEDNFNGNAVDDSVWSIYGENYWDKQSHFSRDNVIVGDGVVRLRFSRQRGHQNDDPNHDRVTNYATGFLDTYGKWVQRYGYFEARMKLPTAPGLWPAFWMMPDRVEAGPQWKRQDTKGDGMEFDIMEHLTRWGPYRYNMAIHWDGYGKEHKSTGTESLYFQPDSEGFMTAGLLWTPGELVWYCNGREVARYTNDRVASAPGCIIFTLPMGGWDNSPLDDAKLPDDFIIDYVRCWQRADLKTAADGKVDPPNTSRR